MEPANETGQQGDNGLDSGAGWSGLQSDKMFIINVVVVVEEDPAQGSAATIATPTRR